MNTRTAIVDFFIIAKKYAENGYGGILEAKGTN